MYVLGTAGHVDHGKSTLVERLTGIDPDRFAEEKRRGLTIDLGFTWLILPSGREVGLVDVPGHERFIKNMLAGAGGVSVCLFVVAANEGWRPQSAEHLAILDILGVQHGVVALTKSDLVSEVEAELAVAEVREKLAPSSLRGITIVPCSAMTGEGIDRLLAELDRAVAAAPPADDTRSARMWIDRVFTIAGSGTVVTGTLMGGSLRVGDEVEVAPEGRRARIRTIQSHKKSIDEVGPGNRVALNLVGLEREGAQRGNAIVQPGIWRATRRVDAMVRVAPAEVTGHKRPLTEKGAHLLYVGSVETPVGLKLLADASVAVGHSAPAQLLLRDPLPLQAGDRFVLRDAGRVLTIGGGAVLDPLPTLIKRKDPARLELLYRMSTATAEQRLAVLLDSEGEIDLAEGLMRTGAAVVPPDAIPVGKRLISARSMTERRRALVHLLERHHSARRLEKGVSREGVRAELGLDPEVLDAVLSSTAEVTEEGPFLRLTSHRVGLAPEQEAAKDRLLRELEEAGFQPPLAQDLGVEPALLQSLYESGELVKVANFYLTAGRAGEVRTRVRAQIDKHGPQTVAEIRDLLETTRKYAVPLCEWLDSTGATLRRGDVRLLGPKP